VVLSIFCGNAEYCIASSNFCSFFVKLWESKWLISRVMTWWMIVLLDHGLLFCVKIHNIVWCRTLQLWTYRPFSAELLLETELGSEGGGVCVLTFPSSRGYDHAVLFRYFWYLQTFFFTTNTWQMWKNVYFTILVTSALYLAVYDHFYPIHIKFNSSSGIQIPSFHYSIDLTFTSLYTWFSCQKSYM